MKTCSRCGLITPESSVKCECGGPLVAGDKPNLKVGDVAGFWIRLVADVIDGLVLGVVGYLIALFFRGGLLGLGERAAILGAPITLLYTGVLQSHIGGGQTLAKRLLGLRVLRLDGRFLSLDRSLVRWSLMGVVCYGGAIAYALSSVMPGFLATTLGAAFGGAQLALSLGCILMVPFHPLKRGLHDLLTGSIVIRDGQRPPADVIERAHNPRRDRLLVIVAVTVAIAGTVVGLVGFREVPANLAPARRVMAGLSEIGIQNPGVVDTTNSGPAGRQRFIVVSGYLPKNADGSERIENAPERALALVRAELPLEGVDAVVVQLRSGINVGIYSSYESTNRVEVIRR